MKKFPTSTVPAIMLSLSPILVHAAPQAAQSAPGRATLQLTQCALKVSGWTCDGCAKATQEKLMKLDGVKQAKVDFKTGKVQVSYDAKKTSPARSLPTSTRVRGDSGLKWSTLKDADSLCVLA